MTADPTTLSHERGTNVIGDAGDHWFPWVAVDQSSGQAYVDLYSTRDDATRKSAKFYARAVVPGAGSTRVSYGPLTAVSSDATNYSDQDCCGFGNDYGDYTGLDAGGRQRLRRVDAPAAQPGRRRLRQRPAAARSGHADRGAVRRCDRRRAAATTAASAAAAHHGHDHEPPTLPTATTPTHDAAAAGPHAAGPAGHLRNARRPQGPLHDQARRAGEAASGTRDAAARDGHEAHARDRAARTGGIQPFKLRDQRLKRKDLALLKRKRKLRVTLAVSLRDLSGNTARGTKTFTLRLKR